MAFTMTTIKNKSVRDLAEFIADVAADIQGLPTSISKGVNGESPVPAGSSCFVIATGDVYMLNHQNQWKLI